MALRVSDNPKCWIWRQGIVPWFMPLPSLCQATSNRKKHTVKA
ncbi:hypothetical protein ACOCGI_001992 [Vibrio cholerae]